MTKSNPAPKPYKVVKPTATRKSNGKLLQRFEEAQRGDSHSIIVFAGQPRQMSSLCVQSLPAETRSKLEQLKKTNTGTIDIPDTKLETLHIYRYFLHNGTLAVCDVDNNGLGANQENHSCQKSGYHRLLECHKLGIAIDDEAFANAAIDGIVEQMVDTDRYPTGFAKRFYESSTEGSGLRKLYVDQQAWVFHGKRADKDAKGPQQYFKDLVKCFAENGPAVFDTDSEMPWITNRCSYHTHHFTPSCDSGTKGS